MAIPRTKRSGRNGSWAAGCPFRLIVGFTENIGMKIVAVLECGHKAVAGYGSKRARCLYCQTG